MNYFIEFFETLKNALLLNSSDSDEDRAKKVLWYSFFGSICLISIVAYILFVSLSFSGKGVLVPHVSGDNIYVALRKISEKNLSVRVLPRYSDETAEGIVIEQSPEQGAYVRTGRKVSIQVSMGKKENALPDFTNLSLFEIASLLDTLYPRGDIPYSINDRIYEFSEVVDKGRVIKQEPAEGTPIKSVRAVKLWISNGIETIHLTTLSNYDGMKLDEVLNSVKSNEINVQVLFMETKKRNEHFTVVKQNLQEGMIIDDINKGGDTLILETLIYIDRRGDSIDGELMVEVPRRNIGFDLVITAGEEGTEAGVVFKMHTKGGFVFSYPYSLKKYTIISAYTDGVLLRELIVKD